VLSEALSEADDWWSRQTGITAAQNLHAVAQALRAGAMRKPPG
jgi:acyl-CoA synthetase (NDP forming)